MIKPVTIDNQLDQFISSFISYHQQNKGGLTIPYDSSWPSTCYQATGREGDPVPWLPQKRDTTATFGNVEEALGITLNEAYCQFFSRYFSDNLPAVAPQGNCELLQVWNSDDFARLQQNLIGHLLMKQRLKQAPTLFFALTDEDDFILSLLNDTGEVVLEQVGKPPKEVVAASLGEFLALLTPR